jgi:large subunit ribosomal protein L23
MRDAREVIISPMVTEKSTRTLESQNVYTFLVDAGANKIEIKSAVERLGDVDVLDVRTMRYAVTARRSMMGRMNRGAREVGRRPSFKKALVVLAEDDHIEFYELG